MPTTRLRIPKDIVKWCIETFRREIGSNFEPTESQIITHALYQLKANWTGEEYEIPENYKEYQNKKR